MQLSIKNVLAISTVVAGMLTSANITAQTAQPQTNPTQTFPSKNNTKACLPTDLFEAMQRTLVTVKFIPLNAERANVMITNLTDDAIDLDLPSAFAAVPVLAQFGGPGGGGFGAGNGFGGPGGGNFGAGNFGNGGQGGQGGQGLGGGFGNNFGGGGFGNNFGGGNAGGGNFGGGNFGGGNFGGGNFGGGGGGGFFRVEPQKTRKLSVTCVCLEFGKPDPTPRMGYQLVPLEEFNMQPEIRTLCQQLAGQSVPQPVAQAVAWHLANGLSWEELRQLNKSESQFTGNIARFSKQELTQAARLASYCSALASPRYTSASTE